MAYKPPEKAAPEVKKGKAKVTVGEKSVRVIFASDKKNPIQIKLSQCPENIRSGIWHVKMDEDETQIMSIQPLSGQYKFKFAGFVKGQDDKVPAPKETTKKFEKNGKKQEYTVNQFVALNEVVDGDAEGLVMPYYLNYNFAAIEIEAGNKTYSVVGYSHPGSKYTTALKEYLGVTGAWNRGEMKWPEDGNVLPTFEKRMLKEGTEFFGVIKETESGAVYIDTFYTMLEDDDFEDVDEKHLEEPKQDEKPDVDEVVDEEVDLDEDDEIPFDMDDEEDVLEDSDFE